MNALLTAIQRSSSILDTLVPIYLSVTTEKGSQDLADGSFWANILYSPLAKGRLKCLLSAKVSNKINNHSIVDKIVHASVAVLE